MAGEITRRQFLSALAAAGSAAAGCATVHTNPNDPNLTGVVKRAELEVIPAKRDVLGHQTSGDYAELHVYLQNGDHYFTAALDPGNLHPSSGLEKGAVSALRELSESIGAGDRVAIYGVGSDPRNPDYFNKIEKE